MLLTPSPGCSKCGRARTAIVHWGHAVFTDLAKETSLFLKVNWSCRHRKVVLLYFYGMFLQKQSKIEGIVKKHISSSSSYSHADIAPGSNYCWLLLYKSRCAHTGTVAVQSFIFINICYICIYTHLHIHVCICMHACVCLGPTKVCKLLFFRSVVRKLGGLKDRSLKDSVVDLSLSCCSL